MEFPTKALVPHYKVQYFDEVTLSWKDVQRTYTEHEQARHAAMKYPAKQTRVMKILGKVREPIETMTA